MYFSNEDLQKLSKEEIIEKYEDLQDEYNSLDDAYSELEDDNYSMQEQIDDLEGQIENIEDLVDMEYLKEKLELYGFKTEALWNFLDDYMRLYNKG